MQFDRDCFSRYWKGIVISGFHLSQFPANGIPCHSWRVTSGDPDSNITVATYAKRVDTWTRLATLTVTIVRVGYDRTNGNSKL